MFSFTRAMKFGATCIAVLSLLLAASMPSQAQEGTVRLHIVKAGFIIGFGGGNGVLYYHGRSYPLRLGGIGIGSLGVAAVDLVGTASNLHSPSDIVGHIWCGRRRRHIRWWRASCVTAKRPGRYPSSSRRPGRVSDIPRSSRDDHRHALRAALAFTCLAIARGLGCRFRGLRAAVR